MPSLKGKEKLIGVWQGAGRASGTGSITVAIFGKYIHIQVITSAYIWIELLWSRCANISAWELRFLINNLKRKKLSDSISQSLCLISLYALSHLIIIFTDEETEAGGVQVTCLSSHSRQVCSGKWTSESCPSSSKAYASSATPFRLTRKTLVLMAQLNFFVAVERG